MRVVDRLGSLQFDPLEVAGRNHDLVLAARIAGYRRAWTDGFLYADARAVRDVQQGPRRSCRPPSCPGIASPGTGAAEHTRQPRSTSTPRSSRSCWTGSGARGRWRSTDFEPRAAIDWYWRPTNQVRAILEALAEAGHPRARPARGQPARLRPRGAAVPGRRSSPSVPTEREQRRHKLLSRYRAHGLLGRSGSWRDLVRHRRTPAASGSTAAPRELLAELVEDGRLVPVSRRGRPRRAVRPAPTELEPASRRRARSRPGHRTARRPPASRSSRRSTRSSGTATSCARCSTSTTSGRSTSRSQAALGLLRAADPVRRPARRPDRAADRARATGTLRVLDLWWEDGLRPAGRPAASSRRLADALRGASRVRRASGAIVLPRAARHRPLARGSSAPDLGSRGRIREVMRRSCQVPQLPALSRARTRTS